MSNLKYSKKAEYNGLAFDSTLELKFALLIEDKCEYIYHPLAIWYDRNDLEKVGKQVHKETNKECSKKKLVLVIQP